MKYTAVFLIFLCLFVSAAFAVQVTTWGNVNGKEVGSENVVVPSTILKVKTYELTFPKVHNLIDFKRRMLCMRERTFLRGFHFFLTEISLKM